MITTMAGSTARKKHKGEKHNVMQILHLKNNYTAKCTSTSICIYIISTSTSTIYIYNLHLQSTSTIYIYNL